MNKPLRIFVAGHRGMVGSAIVRHLTTREMDCRALAGPEPVEGLAMTTRGGVGQRPAGQPALCGDFFNQLGL